ncbi:MAG: hypothetical protein O3A68_05395, partial [Proteobacteria bacterium]|nr:hypothetical protein [Pseudomonadota bacterium]
DPAEVAADCGKVVVGEMNWASGEFLARLDGLVMKEGYGCDVEYLTAGTMPQITSMNEKGTPDIASEMWANAAAVAIMRRSRKSAWSSLTRIQSLEQAKVG